MHHFICLGSRSNPGWKIEKRLDYQGGRYGFSDAMTPSGRPVELKPNTKSGIKKGMAQLKKYEIGAERKGILVLYDPITSKRTYLRTPFQKE